MMSVEASHESAAGDSIMPHPAAMAGPIGKSAVNYLRKTLNDRKRTEQLEGLLRETLYRSVRDELLGNPRYAFTDQDARRDEKAIRSAVIPIVEAALRCARAELTQGRKRPLSAILNSAGRRTGDLGTMSEFSARDKLRGWLIGGVRAVYEGGRCSIQAGAPPVSVGAVEPWGKWWDALADTGYPIVTRAVGQFRDVVRRAADDPNGSDTSRRFAQRLDDELEKNDRRRERTLAAAVSGAAGTLATGALFSIEFIEPVRALLPASVTAAGLSAALITWFWVQRRATPTADEVQELSLAIDAIRDWTVNVEQSHKGDDQRLLNVLERRLLPSLESFDVRLLRASLKRVRGLLEDRDAQAPSYQPASLDLAIRDLHLLIDPQPPGEP